MAKPVVINAAVTYNVPIAKHLDFVFIYFLIVELIVSGSSLVTGDKLGPRSVSRGDLGMSESGREKG